MRTADLFEQFASKQRNVSDLARYIKNRTDEHSNYCLFLGAGCSVTSGIRPASALVTEWRQQTAIELGLPPGSTLEEQINFLREKGSAWYDPAREYSSLFERRFDLQRQRRVFVESEVAGKMPSIGYAYLTSLVEQRYFNTIFTTNFDDLVNEAFYLFSNQRPIVCAHDSSINSVTVTSKRPKVIKLHGDYLFDDLKSTLRETESLEQNMKAKLAEFSKDHGLIVVGYSGADRSIMDNLHVLLRNEDYLKSGVYWCLRKGADVPEELRKLLFRDRVYYVETDGFDELFAELYSIFNPGQYLPESALGISRRSGEALQKLLASGTGVPATTDVLKKAKSRLERHTKRSAIAHLIARDAEDDRAPLASTNLTDDELLLLSEVSELISSEQYDAALQRAKKELLLQLRPRVKRRLIEQCIGAHLGLDDRTSAISAAEEIIRLHPNRASSYLKKSRLLIPHSDKMAAISMAIKVDPYAVAPHLALCDAKLKEAHSKYGEERAALLTEARQAAEKAVSLDPSDTNGAWKSLFDVIQDQISDPKDKVSATESIISKLSEQNPYSTVVLELRRRQSRHLKDDKKSTALTALLADIDIAEDRYSDDNRLFSRIRLRVLRDLCDGPRLSSEITRLTDDIDRDPDLAALVASTLREVMGNDQQAIRLLRDSLRSSQFDWEVLTDLISALCDLGEIDEAQQLLSKWGGRLDIANRHRSRLTILEAKGRFDECLKESISFANDTGIRDINNQVYYLLATEDSRAAEKALREILAPINFTPEAEVEIVNFELARKMNGAKCDQTRLGKVQSYTSSTQTKVGIFAVLDDRKSLEASLKKAIDEDKTARFTIRKWPVMRPHLNDPVIRSLLEGTSVAVELKC